MGPSDEPAWTMRYWYSMRVFDLDSESVEVQRSNSFDTEKQNDALGCCKYLDRPDHLVLPTSRWRIVLMRERMPCDLLITQSSGRRFNEGSKPSATSMKITSGLLKMRLCDPDRKRVETRLLSHSVYEAGFDSC